MENTFAEIHTLESPWQSARWYQAVTLAERIAALHDSHTPPAIEPGICNMLKKT